MGKVEVAMITMVVWKDAPGFVVEIRLKEAQRKRRQSGRESNAVEDVRDSRALLQMVAEEVETRLESI